ncbi:unnamed protein product [Prunus armeniaca]|uniref:Uncharacterized protein n=1 Tax=Prunus armeniaca TaxID=36596 RepID=A0A6J5TJQ2_PRUAR|nr:unnamed protein product [Prunus armeniaca]
MLKVSEVVALQLGCARLSLQLDLHSLPLAHRACFPRHLPLPAPLSLRPPPQNIVHPPPAPSYPQVGPIFAYSLDAGPDDQGSRVQVAGVGVLR